MTSPPASRAARRSRIPSLGRLGAVGVVVGTAALAAAGPRPVGPQAALAHTSVSSKRPAAGTTKKTNITVAVVVFSTTVRSARITVKGPGGRTVSGATTRDAKNAKRYSTRLAKSLKPGTYRAQVIYAAGDGHSQVVRWTFKLSK